MADTSSLTAKQKRIYDFIRDQIEQRGYPPTVREIGEAFHIKSPNGVMCHLTALVKKGLINREKQAARAIQLSDHQPPVAVGRGDGAFGGRHGRIISRLTPERRRRGSARPGTGRCCGRC